TSGSQGTGRLWAVSLSEFDRYWEGEASTLQSCGSRVFSFLSDLLRWFGQGLLTRPSSATDVGVERGASSPSLRLHWPLFTGHSVFTDHWLLTTDHYSRATGHYSLATRSSAWGTAPPAANWLRCRPAGSVADDSTLSGDELCVDSGLASFGGFCGVRHSSCVGSLGSGSPSPQPPDVPA